VALGGVFRERLALSVQRFLRTRARGGDPDKARGWSLSGYINALSGRRGTDPDSGIPELIRSPPMARDVDRVQPQPDFSPGRCARSQPPEDRRNCNLPWFVHNSHAIPAGLATRSIPREGCQATGGHDAGAKAFAIRLHLGGESDKKTGGRERPRREQTRGSGQRTADRGAWTGTYCRQELGNIRADLAERRPPVRPDRCRYEMRPRRCGRCRRPIRGASPRIFPGL
jgi:hypothetical protein